MATFTASPLTDPAPTTQYNYGADMAQGQGLAAGQNALTIQDQQVSDMQQQVALRPGLEAGDPQALNALTAINPAAAQAQREAQIANASMPYQMAQNRINILGAGARGVLASDDHAGAYSQFLSTLPPSISAGLPQTYPGDGPVQQLAFASMSPSDFMTYQATHITGSGAPGVTGGAPPSTYAGAVSGAESGGNAGATSATSSAAGAGQFLSGTWLDEMKQHRPDLTNGQTDAQILALRNNPTLSGEMTNDYASDNTPTLAQHSIPITPASLYTAHHFGPQGAVDLYAAEAKDPTTPVSSILPAVVIKANPGLAGQTVGGVLGSIRGQMSGVPSGTFGAALTTDTPANAPQPAPAAPAAPAGPAQNALTAPTAYQPPPAAPNPVAPGTSSQPAVSAPSAPVTPTPIPAGITPLQHGNGTPALAPSQPGYQLGRDQAGNIVTFPMPGGPADPAVLAQQAQVKAAAGNGYSIGSNGQQAPITGGPADPVTLAVQAHIKAAADSGYQFVRGADGVGQYEPIPGGPADPAAKQRLAAAGVTSGPLPGGAGAVPSPGGNASPPPVAAGSPPPVASGSTRASAGAFPAPPVDPYGGLANNTALADRMNADRTAAATTVETNAGILQKDQQQIENAQEFMRVNSGTPTGPTAGSGAAMLARSTVPFTPSNAPYQTMDKIAAEMKVSGLPSGMGRLDIPIIQAVAKQQPSVTNLRQVNSNIANLQIGRAQRDMMYRQSEAQWVQQNGTLSGFNAMWNDYNSNVPALTMSSDGLQAGVNTTAPSFHDWAWKRVDPTTGRYNPSLAGVPDGQLPGSQPQGQPPPQIQQAAVSAPSTGSSVQVGQIAVGPGGVKLRWDGQQWDATGGVN